MCSNGKPIPKLVNVTLCRNDNGTANVPPYQRLNSDYPDNPCATNPPGFCGGWLMGGDLNGLSAQEVTDTVNDILACGGSDTAIDHNCYHVTGTVDMNNRRRGGQWILARKCWHGIFGVQDQNDPNFITALNPFGDGTIEEPGVGFQGTVTTFQTTAPQTRYRQIHIYGSGTLVISGSAYGDDGTYSNAFDITSTVGQFTGIEARSGTFTDDGKGSSEIFATMFTFVRSTANDILGYFTAFTGGSITSTDSSSYYDHSGSTYVLHNGTANGHPDNILESISWAVGSCSRTVNVWDDVVGAWALYLSETCTISNTSVVYRVQRWDRVGGEMQAIDHTVTLDLELPYSASDCYADANDALNAWDMSNFNLAKLRQDELLALAPLVVYDETGQSLGLTGPTLPNPLFPPSTMDDLNAPIADVNGTAPWTSTDPAAVLPWIYNSGASASWNPTFTQITWLDPNSYVWKYPAGAGATTGGFKDWYARAVAFDGATLITGMRTGAIVSHTSAGSDQHFWFNYVKGGRVAEGDPPPNSVWAPIATGGWNTGENPNLPGVTMRWMDNLEAQFDPQLHDSTHVGNFPQQFVKESGGVVVASKYVQSAQTWPAVNWARPCGADRYAVDQTTVCCIITNAAPVFTVALTGEAANAPADGSYIAVAGDGIYHVDSHTGALPTLALHCTRKDDLPTGFDMSNGYGTNIGGVLGQLRWPTAPGICGRAAVTPSFVSGAVTLSGTSAFTWFLKPTGTMHDLKVYDSSMSLLDTISGSAIARTDDSVTFTHAAMPTAAYVIDSATADWTKNTTASRRTGVFLSWTFNQRVPPGSPYAGISGCVNCDVSQFTYPAKCPMVGIVPGGSPEDFGTSGYLFNSPSGVEFDSYFGRHQQSAVMMVMVDPFWQLPFRPDCGDGTWAWKEDDGSGQYDPEDGTIKYFPHRPWVEALKVIPSGCSLPSGLSLFYASANHIAPPFYNDANGYIGIPCDVSDGSYRAFETDWGFTNRACGAVRFSSNYLQFTTCP